MVTSIQATLIVIIASVTLICPIGTLTTVPTFIITSKYIETGTSIFNTAPYFGVPAADSTTSLSYTGVLARTHSVYSAICSIQSINFQITASFMISMVSYICTLNSNSLVYCIKSNAFSKLSVFSNRYLILDSPYSKNMFHFYDGANYYNTPANATSALSSTISRPITFTGLPAINMTGTVISAAFLNGLIAYANDASLIYDLKMTASIPTSTTYKVLFTSGSTTQLNINQIYMAIIAFNLVQAQQWPFPAMQVTIQTFVADTPLNDTSNIFQSYNTFWGITQLRISGQPNIQWTTTMAPNTSISGTSSLPYNNLQWTSLVFYTKECDSSTPYYMMSNDTCYDICPDYYFGNTTTMLCQSCPPSAYDCLLCLGNGTCTQCDNSTNRALNSATGRCAPVDGYYETGVAMALPCDSNCLTCSTANVTCTACYPSFYLSGSACSPCISNCYSCINGSTCSNCSNSFVLNGSICVMPLNCSAIANCINCSPTLGCLQCSLGYVLQNATNCAIVCGSGMLAGSQQCNDGNTAPGDGCSSVCLIETGFYCLNTPFNISNCYNCSTYCTNCSSNSTCFACSNGFVLNGSACVMPLNCSAIANCNNCSQTLGCLQCSQGYVLQNGTNCAIVCGSGMLAGSQQCNDGNIVSGDGCSSTCQIEVGFYCSNMPFNISSCYSCTPNCVNCTSNTTCFLCNPPYSLNATFPAHCAIDCSNISYCSICQANNATLQCQNCSFGYTVSNNSCTIVCGDGIVMASEQCDNGGNVTNGCSSNCTIQSGWVCTIVSNLSVCSQCVGATYQAPSKTVCLPCSPSCLTCSAADSNSCLSCANSSLINGSMCVGCSQAVGLGCETCIDVNSTSTCTQCSNSSTLTLGTCVFATPPQLSLPQPPNISKLLLMILLPAFLALLLCCCLIIFCIWRRRKNEQNKVEEQGQGTLVGFQAQQMGNDNNKSKINVPESQDPFDQKLMTKPRKTLKGKGNNQSIVKSKKRRAPLSIRQQTQQNNLSLQQFVPIVPFKDNGVKPNSKNTTNQHPTKKEQNLEIINLDQKFQEQIVKSQNQQINAINNPRQRVEQRSERNDSQTNSATSKSDNQGSERGI